MLECLLAAGGRVVSAEELLERVWDEAADPFTTAVKTTIRRLRAKLGDPPVIHTVREGGYRIGDAVIAPAAARCARGSRCCTRCRSCSPSVRGARCCSLLGSRESGARRHRPGSAAPSRPTTVQSRRHDAALIVPGVLVAGVARVRLAASPGGSCGRCARSPRPPGTSPRPTCTAASDSTGRDDEFAELGETLDDLFERLEAVVRLAAALRRQRLPRTAHAAGRGAGPAAGRPRRPGRAPSARCARPATRCSRSAQQQERLIDALLTLASGEQGVERGEPFDLAAGRAPRPDSRRCDRADGPGGDARARPRPGR